MLTKAEFASFNARYPQVKKNFADWLHFTQAEVVIDGDIPSNKELVGDGAWQYLYSHWRPNSYSTNFSESVTNWVHWYYEQPDLHLESGEGEIILSLLDPQRQRIFVHVPTPKS